MKALLIKTKLKHEGISLHDTCSFCNLEEESLNHLFLTYPFSKAIWFGSYLSIKYEFVQPPSIIQWIGNLLENSNQDQSTIPQLICLIVVLLYLIWYIRNLVEFQHHELDVHQAITLFNIWPWQYILLDNKIASQDNER